MEIFRYKVLVPILIGFLGGPANITYGENTPVLVLTKNYDQALLRCTAIFVICLACIEKFGGLFKYVKVNKRVAKSTTTIV